MQTRHRPQRGTHTEETSSAEATPPPLPRLVLVGEERRANTRRVTWTEDVVDNENLNRKKSKICCIYHPPDEFGEYSSASETSDDTDSSSDSDSDSDSGAGPSGRPSGSNNNKPHQCNHKHKPSRPNAYERQPKIKRRPQ